MSFASFNLDPQILRALEVLKYDTPTPVQAAAIPEILKGRDIIATAQTGTGKTAAFVLPILHQLALSKTGDKSSVKPRVLILTPTRELAMQITKATDQYGKFFRLNIVSLLGGMPYYPQIKSLSRPVDIIVATPGRLLDHMNERLDLSKIEILVLDEADRMLDMGFIDDVKKIAKATPSSRQTLLFSATTDDKLKPIINQLLTNPVHIDLSSKLIAPQHIKQSLYMADNLQHKTRLFQHFLSNESIYKAIIFSATKINTDRLAKQLEQQGFAVSALHGGLKQNVRNRVIEQFHRKGQLLIATDVAARGINVADVSHVINYDLPKFCEDYVHRIGRTGRAGKSGIAVSFALPTDDRNIMRIERYIGQRFERAVIEGLEPTKQFPKPSDDTRGSKRRTGGGVRKPSNLRGGSTGGYPQSRTSGTSPATPGNHTRFSRERETGNSYPPARTSEARRDSGAREWAPKSSGASRGANAADTRYPRAAQQERRAAPGAARSTGNGNYAAKSGKPTFASRSGRDVGNRAVPSAAKQGKRLSLPGGRSKAKRGEVVE